MACSGFNPIVRLSYFSEVENILVFDDRCSCGAWWKSVGAGNDGIIMDAETAESLWDSAFKAFKQKRAEENHGA